MRILENKTSAEIVEQFRLLRKETDQFEAGQRALKKEGGVLLVVVRWIG